MTFYLDQDIDISISGIKAPTSDGMYTYKVQESVDNVWNNRFVGNVFIQKGETSHTFHLNDIIEDWKDKNDPNDDIAFDDTIPTNNWCSTWRVVLTVDKDYTSSDIEIWMIYRYPNRGKILEPNLNDIDNSNKIIRQGVATVYSEYKFFPHIPYIKTNNFKFSVFISSTFEYLYNAISDNVFGSMFMELVNLRGIINASLETWFYGLNYTTDNDLDLWGTYETTSLGDYIGTVAKVDICPAKYYLLWQDRYGSMQSQPFTGTEIYSESITQSTNTNYKGYKNISGVDVQPKWKLNTGWITTELYPYYESIFVSPYLKLYITDADEMIDVVLDDSEYTEKTFKNQGKQLFNLEINVSQNKQQNIKY